MAYFSTLQEAADSALREAEQAAASADAGAGGDVGSVATTPFDIGGTLGDLQDTFFGNDAVDPRYAYTAPAGAWSAGTGPTGNPIFQLRDEAGNIVEWAIDALGSMVDVKNLGPAGTGGLISQDPRDNYTAPKGATAIGQDSSGNPFYELVDEAGNLVKWGIDKLGGIIGLENLGAAPGSSAPPAKAPTTTSKPPATTTSSGLPGLTGGPGADLLSNILKGDNTTPNPSGLTITNNTVAPVTTTTSNWFNQITNSTSNVTANAAGQFNAALDSIAGLFSKLAPSPLAPATNDAALKNGAVVPGVFQAGRRVDYSRSQQGSNTETAATVKGSFLTTNQNDNSKYMWVLVAVSVLTLLAILLRRK